MSDAPYDVFLSYSSQDKPLVRGLAKLLNDCGLRVYFDEWELLPGSSWQEALQRAIRTVKSAVILCGPSGLGPWTNLEMEAVLLEHFQRKIPVIPVLLPGVKSDQELPPFLRTFKWIDLRDGLLPKAIDFLVQGIRGSRSARGREAITIPPEGHARLWNVPPLPSEYQLRGELDSLKRALLCTETRTFALLGQHTRLSLQGMGGIGKTVLATALARDQDIRRAFHDGVFWLTLGQYPEDPLLPQARLITALGGTHVNLKGIEDGKATLSALVADRACLLVLDDVWNPRDVEPFNILGEHCKLLLTTRKAEVSRGVGAEPHVLGELPSTDALQLLARYAGRPSDGLPSAAPEIARACGELPLALAMVGARLRDHPDDRWPALLMRLQSADISPIKAALPQYPYDSLWAAIQVSIEDLPLIARTRYLDFAVFPDDTPIPEVVLHTFWVSEGLDATDVHEMVDTFVDRSLARRDKGRLFLHDLQYDYIRARVGDTSLLHKRLLAAYRQRATGSSLHTVTDDGYFFQQVAHHLISAEGRNALRALLFDVRWLAAKLANTGINALLSDFQRLDLGADTSARLLHDALRLSSHVLASRPEELAGQLIGRLQEGDGTVRSRYSVLTFARWFIRRLRTNDASDLSLVLQNARVSATRPGLIPVWPRLTPPGGGLVRSFEGHQCAVKAVAISPDGKFALSASAVSLNDSLVSAPGGRGARILPSEKDVLKLWDLSSGKLVRSFEGHQDGIWAVAITPDGRLALSGSADKSINVWELSSGVCVRSLKGHQGTVVAIAISPDGKFALSGGASDPMILWDLSSGALVRSFGDPKEAVMAVAVSPDGEFVLSGSHTGSLNLWELSTGRLVRSFEAHYGGVCAIAISPDGRLALSSASYNGTLKLWDLSSGALVRSFRGHKGGIWDVAISPDGELALSGSADETLKLWEVASGSLIRSFEHRQGFVNAVAITPDGRLAVSGSENGGLKLWELSSVKSIRPVESHTGAVMAVAIASNGKLALSVSVDGTLKLWDLPSGRQVHSFLGDAGTLKAVAISPDGEFALAGVSLDTLKLWRVPSGEQTRFYAGDGEDVMALAISPDGKYALSGSYVGTLKLWDLSSRKRVCDSQGHQGAVRVVAIIPDGNLALSGSDDGNLKLWEFKESEYTSGRFKYVRSLQGHQGVVAAVAISPDGKLVLSGSHDKTLRLWELSSGICVRSFLGHRGVVNAVAMSPDGKLALSGSDDQTLRLWELATARVLASFTSEAAFHSLAWSPDGRNIIAGDASGHIHLLEVLL